jgi:hypothetical protein
LPSSRHVGGARVRAPDMRPERTGQPIGIGFVGESVLAADAAELCSGHGDERIGGVGGATLRSIIFPDQHQYYFHSLSQRLQIGDQRVLVLR